MFYDIIIIGGGAAGLMAAYGAAASLPKPAVLVLEKMTRPGRKIMITGKGRCNFTNVKEWNDFSTHIRTKKNFLKPAFFNFPPEKMIGFLNDNGLDTVVERGDRAFPASHKASDVVDTLTKAAVDAGAVIRTGSEVVSVDQKDGEFFIKCKDGGGFSCRALIIATGGLSYPASGSSGDGYLIAEKFGHKICRLFPSLTALVPKGYKMTDIPASAEQKNDIGGMFRKEVKDISGEGLAKLIRRDTPLSEMGAALNGIQLKNVRATLISGGREAEECEGDVDFTDGGMEGPVGFRISRDCVKAMIDGNKTAVVLDMKPAVDEKQLASRISALWDSVRNDRRSSRLSTREMARVLLGKLMPWELVPGFMKWNSAIFKGKKTSPRLDIDEVVRTLKGWRFDIEGYVGYERCVVTAGGVSTEEVFPKTMESRLVKGLYFCGEVLDIDSDTGGYNLQTAFSTGLLAGRSAAANADGDRISV